MRRIERPAEDVPAVSVDDAERYVRRVRGRLFPTVEESPHGRERLACRVEVDELVGRLERRRAKPETIVAAVRELVVARGFGRILELVD